MSIKFVNADAARLAVARGDVSPSDVADSSSAEHLRVAFVEALEALPEENATLCQIEYGQWLIGAIQTLDCDFGS